MDHLTTAMATELLWALGRAAVCTALAAGGVWALLAWLRIRSPRVHRAAWLLVIVQGWLLFPWTIPVQVASRPAAPSQTFKNDAPPAGVQVIAPLSDVAATRTPGGYGARPSAQPVTPQLSMEHQPAENNPVGTRSVTVSPHLDAGPTVSAARGQSMTHSTVSAAPGQTLTFHLGRWLFLTWIAGGGLFVLGGLARYALLWRLIPSRKHAPDHGRGTDTPHAEHTDSQPAWHAEWLRAKEATQVSARVELRLTDRFGPLLCYAPFRHIVLAPVKMWRTLRPAEREAILLHELFHVVRGDLWKSLLVRLLALPQWFNPAVWWAARRFDEAGEWACDELVRRQAAGPSPQHYANTLLRVAELGAVSIAGTAGARGGILSRRIRRLIDTQIKEESKMKRLVIPALLIALALAQCLRIELVAADEPVPNPPEAPVERPNATYQYASPSEPQGQPVPPRKDPPRVSTRAVNDLPYDPAQFELTPQQTANLLRHGLPPYAIEPPDIIDVHASEGAREVFGDKLLVRPDGNIDLGRFGKVYVTGKTIAEAEAEIQKAIAEEHKNAEVRVSVASYSSKKVYFIWESSNGSDHVMTLPCLPGITLEIILKSAVPEAVLEEEIFRARIARPGTGEESLYYWNFPGKTPSVSGDFMMRPGDRVFVNEPLPPSPVYGPPVSDPAMDRYGSQLNPTPAYGAPVTGPANEPLPPRVADRYGSQMPSNYYQPYPPAPYAYAGQPIPPSPAADRKGVHMQVVFLEDPSGLLAEFFTGYAKQEKQKPSPVSPQPRPVPLPPHAQTGGEEFDFATLDSSVAEGLLRVLSRKELGKIFSRPTILSQVGHTSRVHLSRPVLDDKGGESFENLLLQVTPTRAEDEGLLLHLWVFQFKQQHMRTIETSVKLAEGESVVMQIPAARFLGEPQSDGAKPPQNDIEKDYAYESIYVVLTPQRVQNRYEGQLRNQQRVEAMAR